MKKLAKLFLSGIIAGSMMLGTVGVFANTNQVVKVKIGSNVANVNGQNVTMDAVPYIQEYTNVTMIPLRFVATALGIDDSDIIYDAEARRVEIVTNKRFNGLDGVVYFLNQNIGNYGYPELKNRRTYVPLRALCNSLNLSVEWDATTKTATMVSVVNNSTNNFNQNNNQTQSTTTSTTLTEKEIREMEEEVVKLVNEERAKYGLQPLEISEKLMETAKMKSEDMATRNYFSHTDPNGYTLYQQIEGLNNFWTIMENCHAGSNTAEGAVNGWMNSTKGHREQILTPEYKYVGVGYVKNLNSEYTNYWVIHFSKDDKWDNSNPYTLK